MTSSGRFGQRAGDRDRFDIVRGAGYLFLALGLGLLGFIALAWRRGVAQAEIATGGAVHDAFARRARTILTVAVAGGALASFLGLVLQTATAAGISFFSALDPSLLDETRARGPGPRG